MIQDLHMHGMKLAGISDATGIPISTLAGYRNLNVEPKHADGERLIALWRSRMNGPLPVIQGSVRQERVRRD